MWALELPMLLRGGNVGKMEDTLEKKAEKLAASEHIQLAAKTCLGKIILEDNMSQMYKMIYCFSQGMGRTSVPGVLYTLSHLVLTVNSHCGFYYPLLYP